MPQNKCLPALFYITASHQLLHHASKKKTLWLSTLFMAQQKGFYKMISNVLKEKPVAYVTGFHFGRFLMTISSYTVDRHYHDKVIDRHFLYFIRLL